MSPPIGTVVFDAQGQFYAGTSRKQTAGGVGNVLPGFYLSSGAGQGWRWHGVALVQNQGVVYYSSPPPVDMLIVDPHQPQTLLASVGGAFMVRSTDGGDHWQSIPDFNGSYSFSSILADPRQEGVYYVASQTIWRSSDYGQTWEERAEGINSGGVGGYFAFMVTGLALDARVDRPVLYASTYSDSLWRSEDEGQHWEYAGKVREGETVLTLGFNPLSGRLYAQTWAGFYVSEDQGRIWTLLQPSSIFEIMGRIRLRFDPQNPERFLRVTGPQLLETRDGGRHWRSLGEDMASVPWFNDVAVDPVQPQLIYAATPWGVYRLDTSQQTAVEDHVMTPARFSLAPNYPNPFNPTTTLRFSLPQAGEAELSIYNLLGQKVAILVRGVQEAGPQVLQWNGQDDQGRELASGVYFYRLQAGAQVETRKLLLLR